MIKKFLTLLAVALLGAPSANAVSVTITNPGFEANGNLGGAGGWSDADPSGWTDPSSGSNGNFLENISGFASDGEIHLGFDQGSDSGLGMIYQDLGTAWAPNTSYTLTVGVGNRSGWGAGTGRFGFGSSLDPAPLAVTLNVPSIYYSDVDTAPIVPSTGTFADAVISFSTGAVAPAGNIRISIQRVSNGGPRLHIDNVRLDATAIPEPSTLAVFGMAAGLLMRRRRCA